MVTDRRIEVNIRGIPTPITASIRSYVHYPQPSMVAGKDTSSQEPPIGIPYGPWFKYPYHVGGLNRSHSSPPGMKCSSAKGISYP